MSDIFISYTSSDRDWAFWIGHELNALGHRPRIHDWELSGGADIMAWMEAQHNTADHVLCVISERYLEAAYSSWERRAAQWATAIDRPNFALPVFVEECKAPTLLAHIKRCDLHGLSEEEAVSRLKAFLAPAVTPPRGPFPGHVNTAPFPGKVTDNAALSTVLISSIPGLLMGRADAATSIQTALAGVALSVFRKAIAIGEKGFGPKHSLTQHYLISYYYARLLLASGRAAEALDLAKATLANQEATHGSNHPWTTNSARIASDALAALGRADDAAALRARYASRGATGAT